MKNDQDHFEVLRKIQKTPDSSQRELAEKLGFSLGKLNYCLKELQKKGLDSTSYAYKILCKIGLFFIAPFLINSYILWVGLRDY